MPQPSQTQQQSTKGEPGQEQQTASKQGDKGGEQKKQEAAEALKKAGQQVAQSGQEISQAGSDSDNSMPQMDLPTASSGEWDPLMPDSDEMTDSESDIFEEPLDASTAGASGASAGSQSAEASSQDQAAAQSQGSEVNDQLADEIRAAQEALEEAGIALGEAGIQLETAESQDELAEAEATLAKARLAVLVAGQDLLEAREIYEDILGSDTDEVFSEAEDALEDANIAIVIATESIFSTRIELPDFEPASAGSRGEGQLDQELNESIAIFEGKILDARREVLDSTPPPTGAENIPGIAVLGGSADETGTEGSVLGDSTIEDIEDGVVQQGRMPEGEDLAEPPIPQQVAIPEDIPDPQGDDIVAQQLREAAIAETNPELQEKLWEEYKRYKAGL